MSVQSQTGSRGWVTFPGGELEGKPPKVMCRACRERANHAGTLCFQCYRAELERDRALRVAASLDTASEARFQSALPFEPVNQPRLQRLRADRAAARTVAMQTGSGRFIDRQRRAQIAARHALQRIAVAALNPSNALNPVNQVNPMSQVSFDSAVHAALLQLPDSWLPFVLSR